MTQKTKSTIDTEISSTIYNNAIQAITGAVIATAITDTNDSSQLRDITNSGVMSGILVIDLNYPVQLIQPTGLGLLNTQVKSAGIIQINACSLDQTNSFSKMCKVIFQPGNHDVSISGWDPSWLFMSANKPSGIPANYTGLLTLMNFGSAANQIVAAWDLLGSG